MNFNDGVLLESQVMLEGIRMNSKSNTFSSQNMAYNKQRSNEIRESW